MLHLKEAGREENAEFKWGTKRGVGRTNKDVQFYESFTYEGVEYFLYDCAYFYRAGDPETSIGKLVKIFETPTHEKRVKVVWFFRPIEIRNILGDYEPHWNEIFLAAGEGVGLSNINNLEAIVQKCNVLCASSDQRNPQASEAKLRMADYFFHHTFDVGKLTISENFADKIAGIEVENFFNRRKDQKLINCPNPKANNNYWSGKSSFSSKLEPAKVADHAVKDGKSGIRANPVAKELKEAAVSVGERRCLVNDNTALMPKSSIERNRTGRHGVSSCQVEHSANVRFSKDLSPMSASNIRPPKKRRLLFNEKANSKSYEVAPQLAEERGVRTGSVPVEVARRPDADKSIWFKQLPWEERLRRANEVGTLVLLENLDPSYTSSEVEDLVLHALNERVEAKMIQRTMFSSPHYGKALVIFKSKDAAKSAILQLGNGCLMLTDRRPVIGRRGNLREPSKPATFPGHLVVDKMRRRRQSEETKNAVSTSHCSQPNTIEHDMAMEWRVLQAKSDLWWKALHERQVKEMHNIRKQLKVNSVWRH